MGKKHKHPEHENLERWLVSYADFITLLFATFVVLYALSQADLAKFKELSVALKQAFNPAKSVMEEPGGVIKGTPDAKILKDSGNSILDKVMPKMPENAQAKGVIQSISAAVQNINQEITKINIKQGFNGKESVSQTQLKLQERGIVISFSSSLFFEPGSAGLKPEAFGILDKVAQELKGTGQIVHVEGHTDNQPIATAVYPSNWELSSARASSVVRYFIQRHQFSPARLAAVGYAHTRPLASNIKEEGRRKNRRVDIVLLFSHAAKDADAGSAQVGEKLLISSESEGIGGQEKNLKITPVVSPPPAITPIVVKPALRLPVKRVPATKAKSTKPVIDLSSKVNISQELKKLNGEPVTTPPKVSQPEKPVTGKPNSH